MPDFPENAEACCGLSICCGGDDDAKKIHALGKTLETEIGHPGPWTKAQVAHAINELWDLAPRGWGLAELLRKTGKLARQFPYV